MYFFHFVGIIIFVTPLFDVMDEPSLYGAGGYLFCFLLNNNFVAFFLGKASILIAMLLALERWFSVIRPFAYKFYFTRKKLLKYIVYILLLNAVVSIHKFFEVGLKNNKCVHVPSISGKKGQQAFVLSYVIGTFLIPSLITWASFLHIWYRTKASQSLLGISQQARTHQKLLLRMCIVTAAVMTVCWLPSQTINVLHQFDFQLCREVKITLIFAMLNSCLNPWIYFVSNKQYRNEFLSFVLICRKNTLVTPEIVMPENGIQIGQVNSA